MADEEDEDEEEEEDEDEDVDEERAAERARKKQRQYWEKQKRLKPERRRILRHDVLPGRTTRGGTTIEPVGLTILGRAPRA